MERKQEEWEKKRVKTNEGTRLEGKRGGVGEKTEGKGREGTQRGGG